MQLITREELKATLDANDDSKLVMVVGPWEFRARHIPGSLGFPATVGPGRAGPRRPDHPLRQQPPSREHHRRRCRAQGARLPQRPVLSRRIG